MARQLLLLLLLLTLSSFLAFAQIPNPGFESWTTADPDGWVTSNSEAAVTITKVTPGYTGNAATRGEAKQVGLYVVQPVLQAGPGGNGFAITGRPQAVTMYYQFFPQVDDGFGVNIYLLTGGSEGSAIAIAAAWVFPQVSSYTKLTVPFTYYTSETPDYCEMQFQIVSQVPSQYAVAHAGSYFLLDDIAFSATTDVSQESTEQPDAFELMQNWPNPWNPATTINYTIGDLGTRGLGEGGRNVNVQLIVYDILGRQVATLVNEAQRPGHYQVQFNGAGLSSGVYFYRLVAGSFVQEKRMMLVK